MTKAPFPGHVKTRLTPPLTRQEAVALNMCFLRDTAMGISRAATSDGVRGMVVYTPVGAEAAYEDIIPADFTRFPQRGDVMGERIIGAFDDILSLGFASACLVGSDSPTVPPRVYEEAVEILAQPKETVVVGPAADGGYYFIGLKKRQPSLFEDISWSTERVFAQTIERALHLKLDIHILPTWYDVDDGMTLRRLCDELFGPGASGVENKTAPATRRFLEEILQREGRERIWPSESKP